jgi:hypothetical protein
MLDAYFRHISPTLRERADTYFPRTVRRHPRNPERTREYGSKFLALYFHVGNAILGYYDAVMAVRMNQKIGEELESRIALLEAVAAEGMDKFCLEGTDAGGFFLARKVAI